MKNIDDLLKKFDQAVINNPDVEKYMFEKVVLDYNKQNIDHIIGIVQIKGKWYTAKWHLTGIGYITDKTLPDGISISIDFVHIQKLKDPVIKDNEYQSIQN